MSSARSPDRLSLASTARTQRSELPNGQPKKPSTRMFHFGSSTSSRAAGGSMASTGAYPAERRLCRELFARCLFGGGGDRLAGEDRHGGAARRRRFCPDRRVEQRDAHLRGICWGSVEWPAGWSDRPRQHLPSMRNARWRSFDALKTGRCRRPVSSRWSSKTNPATTR